MEVIKRFLRVLAFPIGIVLVPMALILGGVFWIFTGKKWLMFIHMSFLCYATDGEFYIITDD